MVLHRDIYWVGRQWAVTGYGVQACDQKQKSKFDIAVEPLRHVVAPEAPQAPKRDPATPIAAAAGIAKPQPAADAAAVVAKPPAAGFHFKWAGSAKFVKPWRIK